MCGPVRRRRERNCRVLLKLSGEALAANQGLGVDPTRIHEIAAELGEVHEPMRRADCHRSRRREFLSRRGRTGPQHGPRVCRPHGHAGDGYRCASAAGRPRKTKHLHPRPDRSRNEPGSRTFHSPPRHAPSRKTPHRDFAGGTGNPYFSTDTAASLRAMEIKADAILKATKVDGIYDADPMIVKDATKFTQITYMEVLKRGLKVMDSTAISLCKDNNLPIIIFNLNQRGNIAKVVTGEKIGSLVKRVEELLAFSSTSRATITTADPPRQLFETPAQSVQSKI